MRRAPKRPLCDGCARAVHHGGSGGSVGTPARMDRAPSRRVAQGHRNMSRMTETECSVDGCNKMAHARGWCPMHYVRWRKHGDLTTIARGGPKPKALSERPPCSIEGCERLARTRGWCKRHYLRWWFHGDPLQTAFIIGDDPARFASCIDLDGPLPLLDPELGPCTMWTGKKTYDGYAYFYADHRSTTGHRWAYQRFVGPIPRGLMLDHLCNNRACVRVDHLEPVTNRENVIRGNERRKRMAA